VTAQSDVELELWAPGTTRTDALEAKVMAIAASAGLTT